MKKYLLDEMLANQVCGCECGVYVYGGYDREYACVRVAVCACVFMCVHVRVLCLCVWGGGGGGGGQ